MNLTEEQLLVMLKKAYVRGIYEHMEQRYRKPDSPVKEYPNIPISDHIVSDLIQEVL